MRQISNHSPRTTSSFSRTFNGLVGFGTLTVLCVSRLPALAEVPSIPVDPNLRTVSLVAQDSSDCANSTVQDDPNRIRGGEIWVTKGANGAMSAKIAMTAKPNTSYHFFLKCVRLLGEIKTDDDGTGMASFDFKASEVGARFAFDMYPEGAPPGEKFQSLPVSFQ
ncbi:hypothetical protein ACQR1Y_12765 [Bradyrhizobium sp. HKCCYLRH3099]|uniref:hypothetical protein n=1 Tax=unclassified Bradyrhizobium TaxID=2631580 RepID=UPI003EC0EA20